MAINRSIDYVSKDFDSIVDALITFATINFGPGTAGNRQWTNFNIDDFSRTWLELVAYVGDQIFFYLDVQATQSNLETATIRSAVLNIAKQFGLVVPTSSSASGLAQFILSTPGTIPTGFRLSAENGSEFFVSSNSPAPGSTSLQVLIPVTQGVQRLENFTARGVQNEEFTLSFSPLVVDTTNSISSLISPTVLVNSNPYTLVDTFIRSLPTDKHFRIITNSDGQTILRFGDGILGASLAPNDALVVNYRTGGGTVGNIPINTLVTLTDSSPFIRSVTNLEAFSGGSDEPTIGQLKELVPDSLKTLERAVTVDDYGNIILANFNNIAKAAAEENITNQGIDVNIYVVPSGNEIIPISTNLPLLQSITDFLDKRKTVTTTFSILDANPIDINIKLTVFVSSGVSRSLIQSNITAALEDFFNLVTGDVDGTGTKFGQTILLNDLYTVVDAITGIDRFEIIKLTYNPRVLSSTAIGTNYLVSPIRLFSNAETSEWLVGAEYTASSPDLVPYSVFRKINGIVTSLNDTSITDSSLNVSVVESVATGIDISGSNNIIFDSSRTFLENEFKGGTTTTTLSNQSGFTFDHTGEAFTLRVGDRLIQSGNTARIIEIVDSNTITVSSGVPADLTTGSVAVQRDLFLVVDSANNVWPINNNDSHSISLAPTSINNNLLTDVVGGNYKVVKSLIGQNILFHDLVFAGIEYNTNNVVFRSNSSFNLIGTIGDTFQISEEQLLQGNFGIPVSLNPAPDGFQVNTPVAGRARVSFAGDPDLSNVIVGGAGGFSLIDSNLNVFEIVAVNDLTKTVDILHEPGVTPDPLVSAITGVGIPASLAPQYYSDRSDISFIIGSANKSSGLGFQAIGSIAIDAAIMGSDLVDGQTLIISDGVTPITFEFDDNSMVSGSNTPITFTAGDNAITIEASIISAISGTSIAVTPSSGDGLFGTDKVVFLQNDNIGTAGNVAITGTLSVPGISIFGMSGGLGLGQGLPSPVIPAFGEKVNDFGFSSGGSTVDHFEFKTSGFVNDITNLRKSEIPQLQVSNIELDLRGGVV